MSKYAKFFKTIKEDTFEDAIQSEEVPAQDFKGFTLLFVDDEENVLRSLRRLFLEENYQILAASSGREAMQVMQNHDVHLVMTDHKMPGMLGTELLKEIKNRWPETIRIMLTGYADVESIMGAVNEGAVYKFITKPWHDEDLRLTVSLALQQYALIRENQRLKKQAKEQQSRIKGYAKLFDEYRGILGKVVVKSGIITEEQKNKAGKERKKDELIGDALIRLNLVTEEQIVKAVQKHQNIDRLDLKEVRINAHVVKFFPRELCEKNRLIPVKLEGANLTIAMADPTDYTKIDNISFMTGFRVTPVIAKSSEILLQLDNIYGAGGDLKGAQDIEEALELEPMEEIDIIIEDDEAEENIESLLKTSGVPPIVRIVNAVILEALRYQASDIHIEPKTKYSIIRYRISGILHTKLKIPSNLHSSTISRIKILSKMDIAERRKPQDGRITIKTGTRIVDVRVATMPTINGEKVVMRVLDKGAAIKKISELGIRGMDLRRLTMVIKKPQGILISTGPTGSGKTTTLYSILYEMRTATKNFETIEDPVEYFLEEASQVYVREQIGLSFGAVLRATLRQDPDVLLVGEIRDYDTADVAFKAALTGHMVLTSLHTNNTIASITRLIDIGVKPYLIASAIEGIIAQRLVRKVCPYCKTARIPDKDVLDLLKIRQGTFDEVVMGQGCSRCNNTGYLGRVGLYEVFVMNDEFRHLISNNYKESEIMDLARSNGMKTLMEDGLEKIKSGVTTPEELLRIIGPVTRDEHKCESCEKLIDRKFLFCPYCGVFKHNVCNHCQMPLDEEWLICPFCGKAKNKDQQPEEG